MLRRREINLGVSPSGPASASPAGAGRRILWSLEDRFVWGGANALRGALDVLRWPFERAAWTIERRLIWPFQERTGALEGARRVGGVVAIGAVAVAAGVAGLLWASGGGKATSADGPTAASAIVAGPSSHAPVAPTLHGAPPAFDEAGSPQASELGEGEVVSPAIPPAKASSPAVVVPDKTAGPAAIAVAQRFSGAFVLYETGQDNAEVRAIFAETATPRLSRSLLRRPPRLPANVEVPRAKVVNVVPGPRVGEDATVSVSLLRVGLTSELRLSMHLGQGGKWQVKDVLG